MNKNIVPEDFSLSMAIFDFLPVLFFGLMSIITGLIINSLFTTVGAIIAFISGLLKVYWKIVVVLKKKNIWPLFLQMRILMPVGLLLFLIGLFTSLSHYSFSQILMTISSGPQLYFMIVGIIMMILMIVFSIFLDSSKAKNNWLEQSVNILAQFSFFLAVLLIYIIK